MHWTDYLSFAGWGLMFLFFVIDAPRFIRRIKLRNKD